MHNEFLETRESLSGAPKLLSSAANRHRIVAGGEEERDFLKFLSRIENEGYLFFPLDEVGLHTYRQSVLSPGRQSEREFVVLVSDVDQSWFTTEYSGCRLSNEEAVYSPDFSRAIEFAAVASPRQTIKRLHDVHAAITKMAQPKI